MKRNPIKRLRQSNPEIESVPVPAGLFEQITDEPLVAEGEERSHRGTRLGNRAGKVVAVGLAALLVGVGVAWSATGTSPVALVIDQIGNRLLPPEPGTNLFVDDDTPVPAGLSIVQPADEDAISELPVFTLEMLQIMQLGHSQKDLDGLRDGGGMRDIPFILNPEFIRATGSAELPSGQGVSVVLIEEKICAFWLRVKEAMCGTDKEFFRKGIYQLGDFTGRQGPWDILGLVDDRVASVSAESSSVIRRSRVENNVFELFKLPKYDVTLTAYDEEGTVLFKNFFR